MRDLCFYAGFSGEKTDAFREGEVVCPVSYSKGQTRIPFQDALSLSLVHFLQTSRFRGWVGWWEENEGCHRMWMEILRGEMETKGRKGPSETE